MGFQGFVLRRVVKNGWPGQAACQDRSRTIEDGSPLGKKGFDIMILIEDFGFGFCVVDDLEFDQA